MGLHDDYTAAGVATYADATTINTRRRGKDMPGRRDPFPGGKAPS